MKDNQQPESKVMPVLFIGHGSPMNAIEDNEFTREWEKISDIIPKPTAILCISAHWLTKGTFVTSMQKPRTIHDFYGFPNELYDIQYNAPGDTLLSRRICELLKEINAMADSEWGLDHGSWSVLRRLYPDANIPVLQLSIDYSKEMKYHYELAAGLKKLRAENILILGSGNIVHNLRMIQDQNFGYDWAIEFDAWVSQCLTNRDDASLVNFSQKGTIAQLSVPTPDHYIPLLYALGASNPDEKIEFFASDFTMGSLSMRSVKIG
jgi:4,5-DOPA dioxygenase extradiol